MTKQKEEKIDKLTEELPELKIKYEKEIEDFLQTNRFQTRLKRIAFIHDKVRYGLQITHSDIEEMKNLSSDFYDATWRRLRDLERIESFYSQ